LIKKDVDVHAARSKRIRLPEWGRKLH
jgi:hypothetical protein